MARAVRADTLPSAPFYVGEAQDVTDFVPTPGWWDAIPAGLLDRIAAARDSTGKLLEVPRVPFVEGEEGGGPPPSGG